ncbi:MAG: pentapeptide repeat-containing protein [Chitinophagales bacterium]|nr:pentapeptide repeat-containing protein [Chitinophagales bacterium]
MEQQNENSNHSATSPPVKSGFKPLAIRNLFPGMLIGVLIGIVGFLAYERYLPKITETLYIVTLTTFGVLVTGFILIYAFKRQITTFLFGSATANAGEVIDDAQKITDAITDRFADTLLRDIDPGARQRIRHVLPRLTNWFIWSRFRNWWWQWLLGIFVSLGGLTGTLLLMNQNQLLEEQNKKIGIQTELMQQQTALAKQQMLLSEASRRSALVVLMSNIMDKVDKEIENQQKGLSLKQKENRKYKLSQSLIGQIAALSHSFKPYLFMDVDTLIGKPLSPERGQLLITLTRLPLDTQTLYKIYDVSTFANSELSGAELSGADLQGIDLRDANLNGANLRKSNLCNALLHHISFGRGADLTLANLSSTKLFSASFIGTSLISANLSNAELGSAFFELVEFRNANLKGTDLSHTIFKFTWDGPTVPQLKECKSLYRSKGIPDSTLTQLRQTHPHLFTWSKE